MSKTSYTLPLFLIQIIPLEKKIIVETIGKKEQEVLKEQAIKEWKMNGSVFSFIIIHLFYSNIVPFEMYTIGRF